MIQQGKLQNALNNSCTSGALTGSKALESITMELQGLNDRLSFLSQKSLTLADRVFGGEKNDSSANLGSPSVPGSLGNISDCLRTARMLTEHLEVSLSRLEQLA